MRSDENLGKFRGKRGEGGGFLQLLLMIVGIIAIASGRHDLKVVFLFCEREKRGGEERRRVSKEKKRKE